MKRQKKQKQVAMKHKTKIHTEARHFASKLGLNGTSKERKYSKEFANYFIFLEINKRGVQGGCLLGT